MATKTFPRHPSGAAAHGLRGGLLFVCLVFLILVTVLQAAPYAREALSRAISELGTRFIELAICASRASC